ncbi:MAG: hypothetical protein ACRCYC_10395 [Paraclostridium sp.]|uniref:hypothetical protein n=1 Tax=Paraclostridium sp. TaxID=2023273 RepID=UPI003F3CF804
MSKSDLAGKTLLANIKMKKSELISMENEKINSLEDIIYEKEIIEDPNLQIKIEDYYNKPLEVLINDVSKYSGKSETEAIDIEFTDVTENGIELEPIENLESNDKELEILKRINNLEERLSYQADIIKIKQDEINTLKVINLELKETLMKEQDEVMKEQDLHNETLSKVEKLLLEKRGELIERQKASRKNWFLKIIDKVKS